MRELSTLNWMALVFS